MDHLVYMMYALLSLLDAQNGCIVLSWTVQ